MKSLNVIESGIIQHTAHGFPLVCYSNFVPRTHHFSDIRLQICRDLENQVRGSSRSFARCIFKL